MNDAELVGLCDEWDAKRPFAEEQVNEIVAGVRRLVCEKQEANMALAAKIRMGTALEADNARLREALLRIVNATGAPLDWQEAFRWSQDTARAALEQKP
jgi:hypothetical protein